MSGQIIIAERGGVEALLEHGVEFTVRKDGNAYRIFVTEDEYETKIKNKIRWNQGFVTSSEIAGSKFKYCQTCGAQVAGPGAWGHDGDCPTKMMASL